MLDFNESEVPGEQSGDALAKRDAHREANREEVRAALLARLESVLATLFPAGKRKRSKFHIGDVLGSPGDSLEIVLDGEKAGLWTDRANGEGGDIFDLIARHFCVDVQADFANVLKHASDLVGRAPAMKPKVRKRDVPVDDLGPATAKWDYLDASGKLIAVVYRYDPPAGGKEFRPWDAQRRKMAPPDPRPLYNQPGMAGAKQVTVTCVGCVSPHKTKPKNGIITMETITTFHTVTLALDLGTTTGCPPWHSRADAVAYLDRLRVLRQTLNS